MFAAVDLGSNSFRLHVGAPGGAEMRIVRSARVPVRLAAGLQPDGTLGDAAIAAAEHALTGFRAILGEYALDGVRVVGTNTLRVAGNAGAVLARLEAAIGLPIEIISGEEEGRLVYMGVQRALALDPARAGERRLVIDIGGGSTEAVVGQGGEILHVESFSIGTQPQVSSHFADGRISDTAFDAAVLDARAVFEDAAAGYRALRWDTAYGSSGTMRAMAEVIAQNGLGDGRLSRAGLAGLRAALVASGHVDAFDLPGAKRERVPALLGGTSVLLGAMAEFGFERVEAIDAGLRLGVLTDLELRSAHQDRRALAVEACMTRFGADPARAARSAAIATALYRQLGGADPAHEPYLDWSCMLHEVGQAISHTGAHKHAAYIIEHADLPGFTAGEQRLLADLVLGHKGSLRKVRAFLEDRAHARMLLAMRLAVAWMHARADEEPESGVLRLRMERGITVTVARAWLARHPTLGAWLEKERGLWSEVGIGFGVDVG